MPIVRSLLLIFHNKQPILCGKFADPKNPLTTTTKTNPIRLGETKNPRVFSGVFFFYTNKTILVLEENSDMKNSIMILMLTMLLIHQYSNKVIDKS
jgi:hypothetical protein